MKKLILVRHAKSSWKHNVIDHERPLNERGFKDADLVSDNLKATGLNVDLVLSSDAMRAKTTADIFTSNLNINASIVHLNHDLYDFSGGNLIEVIKACNDSVNTLMLFGHNHAITAFVNTYGSISIDNVPTSGVVIIQFDIVNWKKLKEGKTIQTLFPRDLK
ncbi:histidine phosphatase family protein [Flavivirga amylovorans]|uniref:Histidine phosphatase family protein n=1 Tax=Flavivirga amylovorans TaxID=870486 RepID=A0ABT8X188_9FLAO|nr:histidine phosphatase family protein [Flavivirga amylovorans]MDO5987689.1 histidine phosphatase family protein [Flavivirga amylovorans]